MRSLLWPARLAAGVDAGRHDRQVRLPEVGAAGQRRLAGARALVVGLGGLGCPAASYLAGAGVGTLGLCDFDAVDATNLHRQPLYAAADVGRPKVEAAMGRLRALDPSLRLVPLPGRVGGPEAIPAIDDGGGAVGVASPSRPDSPSAPFASSASSAVPAETGLLDASALVRGWDVVLDCTDDPAARYALSDACAAARVPLVHGAVSRWEGVCTVLAPPKGPCYRCIFPAPAQGAPCAVEGVLGTVPGAIGTLQAQEALKLLLGAGEPLVGRMLLLDGRDGTARTIALKRRQGCACAVPDRSGPTAATGGPVACPLPWAAPKVPSITAAEAEAEARQGGLFLLDVREPDEFGQAHVPGAHLVPLGELPERLAELPRGRTIACICAVGGRSARAADFLRRQGFDAVNVTGGMQSWMALRSR